MKRWQEADEGLIRSRGDEAEVLVRQLDWLRVAREEKAHRELRFGSFVEYVMNRLGLGRRTAFDRMRLAEELPKLPRMREELAAGRLMPCAIRALLKVVTPETETRWIDHTRGKSVEAICERVNGRMRGDLPETPARPEKLSKEILLELRNETYALMRQARHLIEKQLERSVTDDELIAELAKAKIAEVQAGTTSRKVEYKVVVQACPECEAAHQHAAGQLVRIDPEVFAGLDFHDDDILYLPSAHVCTDAQDIPEAIRREVWIRDHGCCRVPGCKNRRYLHEHHLTWRSRGGPDEAWNLVLVCCAHHRDIHEGTLLVEGVHQAEARFVHADGTPYGQQPELPPANP